MPAAKSPTVVIEVPVEVMLTAPPELPLPPAPPIDTPAFTAGDELEPLI